MASSIQQFVFGYGSLICPHSRAITAPTLARKTVTPVLVRHVERTWAKACWGMGMTAMGVQFRDNAECVGVLLPVNDRELRQFDRREYGYNRVPLYIGDVERVPFLDDAVYEDDPGHQAFLQAKEHLERRDSIKIWMFLPEDVEPPSEDNPIVQSYVDTILRGCLTISEDFAVQFIANTKGWNPNEFSNDNDECGMDTDSDSSTISAEGVYWVDDRHSPIYTRGDQQYMLENGKKLDKLLKRHRDEIQYRTPVAKE